MDQFFTQLDLLCKGRVAFNTRDPTITELINEGASLTEGDDGGALLLATLKSRIEVSEDPDTKLDVFLLLDHILQAVWKKFTKAVPFFKAVEKCLYAMVRQVVPKNGTDIIKAHSINRVRTMLETWKSKKAFSGIVTANCTQYLKGTSLLAYVVFDPTIIHGTTAHNTFNRTCTFPTR